MRKYLCVYIFTLMSLFLLASCGKNGNDKTNDGGGAKMTYVQITQEEARELMASEENYIILDVRTQEEYNSGHIDGAICLPNEMIGNVPPVQLPDKNQLILVYCRSGNRSKQASEKLAKMGYTNVKEFGGIITWYD